MINDDGEQDGILPDDPDPKERGSREKRETARDDPTRVTQQT